MSHRWDCPSEWEARRQGERDYEYRGYRSYRTPYDGECDEAARAYERGQRSAEYAAEERQEEEQRAAAAAARQQQEAEYYQQQYEYEQAMQADYEAEMRRQYEADMQRQCEEESDSAS